MNKERFKNPWFWIGFGGILLAATGVNGADLTSWQAVGQMLLDTVQNPVTLVGVALSGLGVFIDPTTKGIGDS